MKRDDVRHEIPFERENVVPGLLPADKLFPGVEQVFDRNDILITMSELNSHNSQSTPPPRLLPVLQKIKAAYLLWHGFYQALPKVHRHSLGQRIDFLWIEMIEAVSTAAFLRPNEKLPYVRRAIQKTDTLNVLLMVLWEAKSLDNKKYIALSVKLDEIGKMLGGWNGQLTKLNSPK